KILDDRLASRRWLAGDDYGIADMAFWGWARLVPFVLGVENPWTQYPNVKRLLDEISARPAAARVEALRNSHQFKTENDAEAMRAMFPQNERLKSAG
ncbi:MAG: glutathione binding-like protein, partial [Burkholderiales bacterium]|nr:glutathione binding-like protein [Burkholderiales bacterium]